MFSKYRANQIIAARRPLAVCNGEKKSLQRSKTSTLHNVKIMRYAQKTQRAFIFWSKMSNFPFEIVRILVQ